MKITLLLTTVFCLNAAASSYSQHITLRENGASLETVFKKIEKQTAFQFFYNNDLLRNTKRVSISVKDMPLQQVLELCFKDQPLSYELIRNTIVVKKIETPPARLLIWRPIDISGRLLNEAGEPVAGATITVKGSVKRTVAGNNGEFSMEGVEEKAVLLITCVGYQALEIPVNGKTVLEIRLTKTVQDLGDVTVTVINTGYQALPRERATGSYSTVTSKQIEKKLPRNIADLLEGLVPGFSVSRVNNTGAPATSIRGVATFTSSIAEPLYVVDGFPMDFKYITLNPNDIENVTFLKDAAAASIWGARAANGVVVITTRKGKSGPPKVEYYNNFGFAAPLSLKKTNYVGSNETVDILENVYKYIFGDQLGGWEPDPNMISNPVLEILYNKEQGTIDAATAEAQLSKLRNTDNFDQIKKYIYQSPLEMQHNLNISGAGERYNYRLSAGYFKGRLNTVGSENENIFINLTTGFDLRKNLNLYSSIQTNFTNNKSSGLNLFESISGYSPFTLFADDNGHPIQQPGDITKLRSDQLIAQGRLSETNPYLTGRDDIRNKTNAFAGRFQAGARGKLLPGLSFDLKFQYIRGYSNTWNLARESSYTMRRAINSGTVLYQNKLYYTIPKGDRLGTVDNINNNYNIRGILNYENRFGKDHQLSILAGAERGRSWASTVNATAYGYNEDLGTSIPLYQAMMLFPAGAKPANVSPDGVTSRAETDHRTISFFSNAGYTFKGKYTLTGSVRMDEANLFGRDPNNQYKPIWSFGGKWNISRENFMRGIEWLSDLSVRATYGIGGNIPFTSSPYLIINTNTSSMNPNVQAYTILIPPNDRLTWEKTYTTNFGLDFALLNNRISGTIDYYRRYSVDLLAQDLLNPTLGFTTTTFNVGKLRNDGYEIQLKTENVRSEKFGWNTLFNFSYNKNKIEKYYMPTLNNANLANSSSIAIRREGYALSPVFAYHYAGLNAEGKALAYDEKGEKVLNMRNIDALRYMGTQIPPYTLGLTNTVRYGQFDLQFLFVGNFGGVLHLETVAPEMIVYPESRMKDFMKNMWWKPGDEKTTNVPSYYHALMYDNSIYNWSSGDVNIDKSDYIKLREVILTFNIPSRLLKKAKLSYCSINLQGRNLWYWAANKDGYDPEFIDANNGIYTVPTAATLAAGLRIGF